MMSIWNGLAMKPSAAQARGGRASWSEELLTATDWEKGRIITVLAYESGGLNEYKVCVLAPVLREACRVNRPGFPGGSGVP